MWLSRRQLLRLGGLAALTGLLGEAAEACSGGASERSSGGVTTVRAGGVEGVRIRASTDALPALRSWRSASEGAVHRFRSRPDLSPPVVHLNIRPGPEHGTHIFMDSHGSGQEGPLIIDPGGELVWFNPVGQDGAVAPRAMNVQVGSYKGTPVLTWWQGAVWEAHGQGEYVIADTSYSEVARVKAGNGYMGDLHEFFLTPEGTAVFTCYGEAYADLSPLGGGPHDPYFYGVVQEVDVESGRVLFQWRSDQHVGLSESYAPVKDGPVPQFDYFHIDCICLADDGNFIVSARNTWTIYKLDRKSGEVMWRMGGKQSDFTIVPGAEFAWQHNAVVHPGNLLSVFDNGSGDYRSQPQSRGLVLYVDEANRHVKLELQYLHPGSPLSAGALGNVQLLPGGRVLIGWATQAYFTEFGPDGKAFLDGYLEEQGVLSYRAFRFPWSGKPKEPPALATERHGDGLFVFASWNGATGVDSWRVLGGDSLASMSGVGRARWAGFETVMALPHRPKWAAVEALGQSGETLARSPAVRTPEGRRAGPGGMP